MVESSSVNNWTPIDYRPIHGWEYGESQKGSYIKPIEHSGSAVFNDDVAVTIAYGAKCLEDFSEPWTETYSDRRAASVYVVLKYNGVVVHTWLHVYVDGFRYLLPIPDSANGKFSVPKNKQGIGRLMFGISGTSGYAKTMEEAFKHACVTIEQ